MHISASFVVFIHAAALASARLSHKDEHLPQSVRFTIPDWVHRSRLQGGALLWKEKSDHGKAYGQDHEDIIATNRYFHDMHNDVFLELGAADGRFCSNTKLFEDSRCAKTSAGLWQDLDGCSYTRQWMAMYSIHYHRLRKHCPDARGPLGVSA